VPKTYLAEVAGVPGKAALRRLRDGVDLEDGRTAPARARLTQTTPTGAALEVVIHEGRNRQVRRMCEAVGHPVRRLVRTRFGPLRDHSLAPGEWRSLKPAEIQALYAAVGAQSGDTEEENDA
ncbi:MAG: rRNA synthase, partial [Actinomycetota bacterium]|nr:rRNA synthase [Actinomycetota bacterium]